jgi:CcmD family protein
MVAAYLVIWLAVFIFLLIMVRRQSNLQREISALRELTQESNSHKE